MVGNTVGGKYRCNTVPALYHISVLERFERKMVLFKTEFAVKHL